MVWSEETEHSVHGKMITGANEDFDRWSETMTPTHGLPPACVGRPACQSSEQQCVLGGMGKKHPGHVFNPASYAAG